MLTRLVAWLIRVLDMVRNQFIEEALKYDSTIAGIRWEEANHTPDKWGKVTLPKDSGLNLYYFNIGRMIESTILELDRIFPNDNTLPLYTRIAEGVIEDRVKRKLQRFRGPFKVERILWSLERTYKAYMKTGRGENVSGT